ncbi:MAG: hypothetical protein MJZ30_11570 [Paludibacteraceae bacterium]|nr:hypothetical protein [Paludibacteraceae bacterium]
MAKKIKVTIVFGEDAANLQHEKEYKTVRGLKKCMEANNVYGRVVTREFDTLAEKEAYLQGVKDMDGWLDWCIFKKI